MKYSLLLGALLAWGGIVRADILMVRFNPADGEIKTVNAAARERGEKMILFPQIDPALVAKHAVLVIERDRLAKEQDRAIEANKANDERSLKISERLRAIDNEVSNVENLLEAKEGDFETLLAKLSTDGVKLSSVVISGHNGNGDFWGSYGSLSSKKLTELFQKFPSIHTETRSLGLLGCYTSSVGALETYWKGVIPSVRIVGGYDGSAPLAVHSVGHQYLLAFLRRDSQLGAAKTPADLMSQFKRLPAVKQMHASIATREAIANGGGSRSIEDLYKDCEKIDTSSELRRSYECYRNAEKGCEDPPTDTKKGVLRKFYNELHAMEHCRALLALKGDAGLPRGKEVLRLLYFHTVRGNFLRNHTEDLKSVSELLSQRGIETEFENKLSDTKVNRSALRSYFQDVIKKIDLALAAVPKAKDSEELYLGLAKTRRGVNVFNRILLMGTEHCVPSKWVDPEMNEHSPCLEKGSLDSYASSDWQNFMEEPDPNEATEEN